MGTHTIITRHRTDEMGRTWITIDRATADLLTEWRERTWTEVPDVGYGDTERVTSGPIYDALAAIHDACIAAGDEWAFVAAHEYLDARLAGDSRPMGRLISTCGVSGYATSGYYLGG